MNKNIVDKTNINFRIIRLLLLTLLFFIISNTIAQTLFRSDKYQFRVKYPGTWEYQNGDGPNVVFKIVNSDDASINIVINEDNKLIGHTIEEVGIDNYVSILKETMKAKYDDYEIIDYSDTFIDNVPAFFVKSKATYHTLDYSKTFTNLQYTTSKGKYIYTFTAGVSEQYFNYYESIFKEIISSFVFEN